MCKIGERIRSGKFPAILYSDGTELGKSMQEWLEDAGANYTISDATVESMEKPVLVVDGAFLSFADVKEVLEIR